MNLLSPDSQLKAHQLLVSAMAKHQWHKRHIEHTLFSNHAYRLMDGGHRGQRFTGDGMITADILCRHIDKLRILDADGIGRIGIVHAQRLLPTEHGQ